MQNDGGWSVIREQYIQVGDAFFPVRYTDFPDPHFRPSCYDDSEAAIYIQFDLEPKERIAALLHELDELILHQFKQPIIDKLMQAQTLVDDFCVVED